MDERQVFVCKLIGKKELFYKGDENYLLIYVYHDQTYNLDNGTQVDTLLSNDSGVAFIVKTKEGTIYHAGDLNDWYWDGEPKADNQRLTSAYRAEIRKIKGMHFDAAFVPLDPRQGNHYADGILYFLKNVDCNVIFPMHYWNDASVIKRFITEYTGADAVQQPVHRVGNPMDIANMVLFLCSEKAGFITGENICIDGGMTKQMIYHGDCGWRFDI